MGDRAWADAGSPSTPPWTAAVTFVDGHFSVEAHPDRGSLEYVQKFVGSEQKKIFIS